MTRFFPTLAILLVAACEWHHAVHAFAVPLGTFFSRPSLSRLDATNNDEETLSGYSFQDSFNLIVLGDLHMEDDMQAHLEAREDCIQALRRLSLLPTTTSTMAHDDDVLPTADTLLEQLQNVPARDLTLEQLQLLLLHKQQGPLMKCHLVSLGDLGRKDIRHEPGDAGTTECFHQAKTYLDGFQLPQGYNLITGNHDLEGLDEFNTDHANLHAWMDVFHLPTPQFYRYITKKTLLIGLSTTRFRDAPGSSHEVHIDNVQLSWFQHMLKTHPASQGWNILVFSHAPIMGSQLRVLQNVHVVNGCAWLNHLSENRNVFIKLIQQNPQIKLWCSGHFHLSHDYPDALSTVGACTFLQVGVVGKESSRDGRRQTRIVQGAGERLRILTIHHHKRDGVTGEAEVRLDAVVNVTSGEVVLHQRNEEEEVQEEDFDGADWFRAYVPEKKDGCYLASPNGQIACAQTLPSAVCWWHMADGAVLGLHGGQLVEYDSETLSPLGIVVSKEELDGRKVLVIEEGTAVVMVREKQGQGVEVDKDVEVEVEVVHPNEDGSYWRRVQRNKRVRQEEKKREAAAKLWLERQN